MLAHINLKDVLFFDIETVSGQKNYDALDPTMQGLWTLKAEQLQRRVAEEDRVDAATYYPNAAGIYAEFGKIVCISVGVVRNDEQGKPFLYLKSYYNHDEKQLLQDFVKLLEKSYGNPSRHYLCGHNIKEFDVPYICRRMVIHGLELPPVLDLPGKKPWELKHLLDTMEAWKFGDYKSYTSLKLLCGVFGIPTPKDDIDGSEVGRTYWEEDDLERIEVYCKKDVLATAQLFVRYQNKPLFEDTQVQFM